MRLTDLPPHRYLSSANSVRYPYVTRKRLYAARLHRKGVGYREIGKLLGGRYGVHPSGVTKERARQLVYRGVRQVARRLRGKTDLQELQRRYGLEPG